MTNNTEKKMSVGKIIALVMLIIGVPALATFCFQQEAVAKTPESTVEVNIVDLPEYKIQQLLEVKKATVGDPLGDVKDNQLVINYSKVR